MTIVLLEPMNQYLKIALSLAEQSQCKQKHGAVLVRGGCIIGMGHNRYQNQDKYSGCVHAEIVALRSCSNSKGARLYVGRVDYQGHPRLSKPCRLCMVEIEKAGVKEVRFSE